MASMTSVTAEGIGIAVSLLSALFNGCVLLFFKIRCVRRTDVDEIVYSWYVSIGSLVASLVLVTPFLSLNRVLTGFPNATFPVVTWQTWLTGLILGSSAGMSYLAVSGAGVAIGHSIWAAVNMLTSYVIGLVCFQDVIYDVPSNVFGVLMLVGGAVALVMVPYCEDFAAKVPLRRQRKSPEQPCPACVETGLLGMKVCDSPQNSPDLSGDAVASASIPPDSSSSSACHATLCRSLGDDVRLTVELEAGQAASGSPEDYTNFQKFSGSTKALTKADTSLAESLTSVHEEGKAQADVDSAKQERRRFYLGVLWAVLTGLVGGSCMIPMRYAPEKTRGLAMFCGFGLGAFCATSLVLVGRILWLWRRRRRRDSLAESGELARVRCCWRADEAVVTQPRQSLMSYAVKETFGWAVIAGFVWIIGFAMTIIAKPRLGFSVAFMLTHLSLLVATVWAIVVFKELKGWKKIGLCVGFGCVCLVGAYLLQRSTKPSP